MLHRRRRASCGHALSAAANADAHSLIATWLTSSSDRSCEHLLTVAIAGAQRAPPPGDKLRPTNAVSAGSTSESAPALTAVHSRFRSSSTRCGMQRTDRKQRCMSASLQNEPSMSRRLGLRPNCPAGGLVE